jgi:AraC-like DNA-binding protein
VSALINGHYKQNFYDFVNDYRVRDAQRQLENPSLKSKTIQRVFEDAGFTPSEYRKAACSDHDAYLGGSVQ